MQLTPLSRQIIKLTEDRPTVQSFNRQLVRIVVDAVGAQAATLWLVQESELVISEELEQEHSAVRDIAVSTEEQQKALRQAFEEDRVVSLSDRGGSRWAVFVPVAGLRSNIGVLRLLIPASDRDTLEPSIRAAETLCGYYSLYNAQRVLEAQQEERKDIDRLSKGILQLQHYTFSRDLAEVAVNSAMEFLAVDRVVLLTYEGSNELSVKAASSVPEPNKNNAWARLLSELGELVLLHDEPFCYFSDGEMPEAARQDQELKSNLNSYLLMAEINCLLMYPLMDGDQPLGVLVFESSSRHRLSQFEQTLCTVYAGHTASALANHRAFSSLPGSRIVSRRVERREEGTKPGESGIKTAAKVGVALLIAGALIWFLGFHPVPDKVEGKCFVTPNVTRLLTARSDGKVEKVAFQQGERVARSELLIKLETDEKQLQLSREKENARSLQAQIRKLSGQAQQQQNAAERGKLLAKVEALRHQLAAKEQTIQLLEKQLENCYLRSPIDGTVLSPEEPQELLGVTVKRGESLARIGSLRDKVRVKIAVPGERISDVEKDYEVEISLRPLIIDRTLHGRITHLSDRSTTYKNTNVFMATAPIENPIVTDPGSGEKRPLLKAGMTGKAQVIRPEKSTYAAIYGKKVWRKVKYWMF